MKCLKFCKQWDLQKHNLLAGIDSVYSTVKMQPSTEVGLEVLIFILLKLPECIFIARCKNIKFFLSFLSCSPFSLFLLLPTAFVTCITVQSTGKWIIIKLIKNCLFNSVAWSMRTFLILPAYNTELELLCKEILNLDIKEGRLITLGKCQFVSDVLKRRLGTRPMSKVWSEIQSRLVPASPVTGWKVSLELGAAARRQTSALLGLCWSRADRGAALKYRSTPFRTRSGNGVESYFHITMNSPCWIKIFWELLQA